MNDKVNPPPQYCPSSKEVFNSTAQANRLEKSLQESEMFEAIIQHSPFGVWVVDDTGIIVFQNHSAGSLVPPEHRTAIGSPVSSLLPTLTIENGMLTCKPTGTEDFENIIALPSSIHTPRYCEVSISQFKNAGGKVLNIVSLNEVTSRIRAWQAIKDQEERWNLALEGSQIGVFESDLRSGQGLASDAWYQLLGIKNSDGRNSDEEWRAHIHPEDRARVEAIDNECIEGRVEKSEAKFRMMGGDGSWRWMRSILRVTERDDDGKAMRLLGTMIDITSLESAVNLAEARREGLEMLLANAPLAMAVLALDGSFLLLNDACYELFGYRSGELEKNKFWTLSGGESLVRVKDEVDKMLCDVTKPSRIEVHYVKPNGDAIDISFRLSVVRSEDINNSRLIFQMVDITEKKRLDSLKDNFVAIVSHEMRTPLASIHGALRLLVGEIGENASDRVAKLVEIAERNSFRLTEVVNDLLDFQKLSAGHLSVKLAEIDTVDLVKQTIDDNRPVADQFNVSVQLRASHKAVFIQVDAQRFKQVVTNLLSNASKFANVNSIVRVEVQSDEQHCTVSVKNSGSGFLPDFGKRIFEPFTQQEEHMTRRREGTGLGLAITKELVENMGGEIGFQSIPDQHTTFWVRFPLIDP